MMSDNNWNGKGVPEVGQIMETLHGRRCELIANDRNEVGCFRFISTGSLVLMNHSQIKPIPDKVKVARENAIYEMLKVSNIWNNDRITVEKLYDAGYRKVRPLNQHDLIAWFRSGVKDTSLFNYLIRNGYCIGEE
jgi:hypothetical protein